MSWVTTFDFIRMVQIISSRRQWLISTMRTTVLTPDLSFLAIFQNQIVVVTVWVIQLVAEKMRISELPELSFSFCLFHFSLLFRLAAPKHLTGWGGRGEQLAAQCKRWRASRPLPAVQPSPGPAQDSRRPSPSLCGAPRGLLSRRCRSTRRSCPRARRVQKANA